MASGISTTFSPVQHFIEQTPPVNQEGLSEIEQAIASNILFQSGQTTQSEAGLDPADIGAVFRSPFLKKEASAPMIYSRGVTGLCRELLVTPGGKAFLLMTRCSAGIDRLIGSGALKKIMCAFGLHDGRLYALGVCNVLRFQEEKRDGIREDLNGEAAICDYLAKCNLPYIANAFLSICMKTAPGAEKPKEKYYFLMKKFDIDAFEFFDPIINGEKPFPLERIVRIAHQMLQAVSALHRVNIFHRDLKLENFLMGKHNGEYYLGLCDFGFSKYRTPSSQGEIDCLGTIEYMAPEIVSSSKGIVNHVEAEGKVDVWALGILFGMMFYQKLPPWMHTENPTKKIIMIRDKPSLEEVFKSTSPLGKRLMPLVHRMVATNPTNRCTSAEAQGIFEKTITDFFTPPPTLLLTSKKRKISQEEAPAVEEGPQSKCLRRALTV